jgi:hypothetical protein
MADNKYNGWTNYETWNVKLWLGNEEGSDGYWREQAQAARDTYGKDDGTYRLADQMREEITNGAPEVTGLYSDLLTSALGAVSWQEIAEHYIDDTEPGDNETEGEDDSDSDVHP